MQKIRELYEHLELDVDDNFYWFLNADVSFPYKVSQLKDFLVWWRESEENEGPYWKGTRLFFTFENQKYMLTWTFYQEKRIKLAIDKLTELGASNIFVNYGELD